MHSKELEASVRIRKHFSLTINVIFFSQTATSYTFDIEAETFTLRDLMKAPLLKNKEEIEVRTLIAAKNHQ